MRQESIDWIIDRVEVLSSFPTYKEAVLIVKELETFEDRGWYGWLLERQLTETIAEAYKAVHGCGWQED